MIKTCLGILCCAACALFIISCTTQSQQDSTTGSGIRSVALGDLPVDRCFVYIEGENYKDKSGGTLDYKDGAYGKKCLGMRWGEKLTDFVDYEINLESPIDSALLVIRVAIDNTRPQNYQILLNDRIAQFAEFQPTGGYGYKAEQWKCYSISLGEIAKGRHILKIRPSRRGGIVNIDCLALGKTE